MQEETQVPVYFAQETPEITEIYNEVQSAVSADAADSAAAGENLLTWPSGIDHGIGAAEIDIFCTLTTFFPHIEWQGAGFMDR